MSIVKFIKGAQFSQVGVLYRIEKPRCCLNLSMVDEIEPFSLFVDCLSLVFVDIKNKSFRHYFKEASQQRLLSESR